MIAEFVNWAKMNGNGGYVWSAYGLVFGVIGAYYVALWLRLKRLNRRKQDVSST